MIKRRRERRRRRKWWETLWRSMFPACFSCFNSSLTRLSLSIFCVLKTRRKKRAVGQLFQWVQTYNVIILISIDFLVTLSYPTSLSSAFSICAIELLFLSVYGPWCLYFLIDSLTWYATSCSECWPFGYTRKFLRWWSGNSCGDARLLPLQKKDSTRYAMFNINAEVDMSWALQLIWSGQVPSRWGIMER